MTRAATFQAIRDHLRSALPAALGVEDDPEEFGRLRAAIDRALAPVFEEARALDAAEVRAVDAPTTEEMTDVRPVTRPSPVRTSGPPPGWRTFSC